MGNTNLSLIFYGIVITVLHSNKSNNKISWKQVTWTCINNCLVSKIYKTNAIYANKKNEEKNRLYLQVHKKSI